jgi:hypothetical protein
MTNTIRKKLHIMNSCYVANMLDINIINFKIYRYVSNVSDMDKDNNVVPNVQVVGATIRLCLHSYIRVHPSPQT